MDFVADPAPGGPWVEGFDPYSPLQNPDGSLTDVGLANQQLIAFYQGNVQATCSGLSGKPLGACAGNFAIFGLPWSASEAVLEYPRVLTLGGSLDYQIPRIDTVLRLEVAYDVDRGIQDTSAFDGVSDSEVLLAAIGLDRSTFIPFINPNRTAFLSFQTFLEHIIDYEDGRGLGDGMVNYETTVISTLFMQNFWRNDSLVLTNFVAYDWQGQAWLYAPQIRWLLNQNWIVEAGLNIFWGAQNDQRQNIRDMCPGGELTFACVVDPSSWNAGQWQGLNRDLRRTSRAPWWNRQSFADQFAEDRDEAWIRITYQF